MAFEQTIIIGNLGRDAEMRYLQDGTAVANFSVAVNRVSGSADNRREFAKWYRVAVWREQAERLSPYLVKGKQVQVVGYMNEPRAYMDADGKPAASLEMTATSITLLGSAGGAGRDQAEEAAPVTTEDVPF